MSRRRTALAVAVALGISIAATASAASDGWTQKIVDAGVDTCAKGLPRAYCTCIYETIRQRYTLADYLGMADAAKQDASSKDHVSPQEKVAAEDCLRRANKTDANKIEADGHLAVPR